MKKTEENAHVKTIRTRINALDMTVQIETQQQITTIDLHSTAINDLCPDTLKIGYLLGFTDTARGDTTINNLRDRLRAA